MPMLRTLFTATVLLTASQALASTIDLHAHLFFHEGVGLNWFGSFTDPIHAQDWTDRIRSKVNEAALIQSQTDVVVVALYAHPLFLGSTRDSIRRQIRAAREFCARNPAWHIVRSPFELDQVLKQKHRALILSLEGASDVLENESDFKEFVDQEGIRIVTPLHFLDDEFGGTALIPGFMGLLASPWAWIKAHLQEIPKAGEVYTNRHGLSEKGRWLIQNLLDRHVWIDLAHASDAAFREVTTLLEQKNLPPLYTHAMLRRTYGAERGISVDHLQMISKLHGLVGVLPSDDMVRGTQSGKFKCEGGVSGVQTHMQEMANTLGTSVGIGSDINAPIRFLKPDCPGSNVGEHGFFSYAQMPALREQLKNLGVSELTAEDFSSTWRKIQ